MRDIKGHEGRYAITKDGRVWSHITNMFLKLYVEPKGYAAARLCVPRTVISRRVHRLVAEAFIPNPLRLETVNHKNGIKLDNRVGNLEWLSARANTAHAVQMRLHRRGNFHQNSKLTELRVREIRRIRNEANPPSYAKIARMYNVSTAAIQAVVEGRNWKYVV